MSNHYLPRQWLIAVIDPELPVAHDPGTIDHAHLPANHFRIPSNGSVSKILPRQRERMKLNFVLHNAE
jgi:hypothetical protein